MIIDPMAGSGLQLDLFLVVLFFFCDLGVFLSRRQHPTLSTKRNAVPRHGRLLAQEGLQVHCMDAMPGGAGVPLRELPM